jgi:transcription termination factor Rho
VPILGADRQPPHLRRGAHNIRHGNGPAGQERIFVSETTESLDNPQVSEDADAPTGTAKGRARRGSGLSGMVLADLKALAGQLGIKGTSGMRKGDLVAAIAARQNGAGAATPSHDGGSTDSSTSATPDAPAHVNGSADHGGQPDSAGSDSADRNGHAGVVTDPVLPLGDLGDGGADNGSQQDIDSSRQGAQGDSQTGEGDDGQRGPRRNRRGRRDGRESNDTGDRGQQDRGQQDRGQQDRGQQDRGQQDRGQQGRDNRQGGDNRQDNRQGQDSRRDDDDDRSGRRGRRYRDRNRRGRDRFAADAPVETEVRDDDVLVPVAGILDVLDSYAFIRTSGYLTGPNDVYVSLSQVRKNGLRRGDAVTGSVRALREGEQQRQKFNALVRLDTVNGLEPEQARNRPEFTKLTPLYPNERLRLETESHLLTTRVIDLVMPVGKGQRALIVSPPKAGKTMVMQAIANAITTNNPECHLMVVLVDERPEEVTDMQRSVKGEVIASTFDRPPADHTLVAELSIERAKRLVEMGRDVVVLLDSITRLGRAYNLAAPASGRILSGGVDSTALFPPKRFLGAARNIENGGSLTIFASALVETGSAGDTVIFEEFKGTGNAELKLDRRLADKRIFPAIDVDQSSTRKEDLLLAPDELAVTVKLRRVLAALDTQQALELVLDRLRKTRNNVEFLMQVAKNTPGSD